MSGNIDEVATASSECQHTKCIPTFDAEAARGLEAYEVRRRWPRFEGTCPNCNESVIVYGSIAHYLSGDW